VLRNLSENVQPGDGDVIDAIEDVSISATMQACRNWRRDGHLLAWSEYKEVPRA